MSIVRDNIRKMDVIRGAELIQQTAESLKTSPEKVIELARTDPGCPPEIKYLIEKATEELAYRVMGLRSYI